MSVVTNADTIPLKDVLDVCIDVIQTDDMEVRSISSMLKVLRRIVTLSPAAFPP